MKPIAKVATPSFENVKSKQANTACISHCVQMWTHGQVKSKFPVVNLSKHRHFLFISNMAFKTIA